MIPIIVHQFFTYGILVCSLMAHTTFILISTTTHSVQIERYRYLMILFAVTDVMVSSIHLILMPGIQIALDGFIFFGLHLINKPAYLGVWAGIGFVIFFYQTFIILAFHYIYRYAVVCDPKWCRIIKTNMTLCWSCAAGLVQPLYTVAYTKLVEMGFIPSDYKTAFYRPHMLKNVGVDIAQVELGYLATIIRKPSSHLSHTALWQMDTVVAISGGDALSGFTAVIIFICSFLILRRLRIAKYYFLSKCSLQSNDNQLSQHQLLKALIVQMVYENSRMISSNFRLLSHQFSPTFRWRRFVPCVGFDLRGIYGDLLVIFTAVCPALDPIIMLYFVKRSYVAVYAYFKWIYSVVGNESNIFGEVHC
uniref:G protein-coupled receptor n=1 Tax=Pristionchus pacificus TaxID=54126 RepID=A0A8R1Z0W6_PRIPA